MGEDIKLDRIKNAAKRMNTSLEKQIVETRNKEKKQELQYLLEDMDKATIEKELSKSQGVYRQLDYSISNKKIDLKNLSKNPEVKRYISLMSTVNDLEEEKKLIGEKIGILEQKLCDHKLLYLMTFPKESKAYYPTFRCLCCGKAINGIINEDQIVINKDFLDEDQYSYKGNVLEYMNTKFKYFELLEQGETEEEILVEIQDELCVRHDGARKKFKLIRKRDDN